MYTDPVANSSMPQECYALFDPFSYLALRLSCQQSVSCVELDLGKALLDNMAEDSKKRPAEDNTNTTPRKKLLNPFTWFSPNLGKDDDNASHDSDDSDSDPVQLDQRTIANMIDADFAARQEKALIEELAKDPCKLDFQIDMVPSHPEWKKWHKRFKDELTKGSVLAVLEKNFTDNQRSLIEPPLYAGTGATLEIQKENKDAYDEALKGTFKGQKDNLTTKLTMLHFGLPVGPLTLNNVLNADKDEFDLPDDDPEPPRVQRIMFAEKPLEFLDKYYERGYGYPMLRLTGRRQPRPALVQTSGGPVNMRGGAGKAKKNASNPDNENSYFLYSHYDKGRQIVETKKEKGHPVVIREEFGDAAQLLLQYDEDSDWEYVVDQYRNQEAHKNIAEKTFVRSFNVTKSTFDKVFDDYLKARVSNTLHDWVMVVRYNHTPDQAPATFKLPSADSPGDPPAQYPKPASPIKKTSPIKKNSKEKAPKDQNKSPKKSLTKAKPGPDTNPGNGPDEVPAEPESDKARLYNVTGGYVDFGRTLQGKITPGADFEGAVKRLLNLKKMDSLRVDFYSTQLGKPKKYDCYTNYPSGGGGNFWTKIVEPKVFSDTGDVSAVVYVCAKTPDLLTPTLDVKPNLFWPPWDKAAQAPSALPTIPHDAHEEKKRARVYGADNRAVSVGKSHERFLAGARRILGIGSSPTYSFCVELHSLQLDKVDEEGNERKSYKFHHHILIDEKDNMKQIFDHFLATPLFYLGDEWFVRVVGAFTLTPQLAPVPLSQKGQSTHVTPTDTKVPEVAPASSEKVQPQSVQQPQKVQPQKVQPQNVQTTHDTATATDTDTDDQEDDQEKDDQEEDDQDEDDQEEDDQDEDDQEDGDQEKQQHAKQEAANQEAAKQEAAKREANKKEAAKQEQAKAQGSPKKGGTQKPGSKPGSKQPTPKTTPDQPLPANGYVYGYAGKALVHSDVDSFKDAAIHLLNLDPDIDWFVWISTYKSDGTLEHKIPLQKSTFSQFFSEFADNRDSDGNWRVFLHKSADAPDLLTDREPCSSRRDVAVVRNPNKGLHSYWRLPEGLIDEGHGLNQFQPDFFRALQVHFPSSQQRPQDIIKLDKIELGYGSMELGHEALERVKKVFQSSVERIEFTLNISRPEDNNKNPLSRNYIGIRMVGNHSASYAPSRDYASIGARIEELTNAIVAKPRPDRFRLWRTAADRESGLTYKVISYKPKDRRDNEIRDFLDSNSEPSGCFWFRPEWPRFSIEELDNPSISTTQMWDVQSGHDLSSFRGVLAKLFASAIGKDSDNVAYHIVNSTWPVKSKFVVTKSTTDDEWRRDIFDWFQSNEMLVKRTDAASMDLVIKLDPPRWGLKEDPVYDHRVPDPGPAPDTAPNNNTNVPLLAPNAPTRNKERILKARAAKPKPQKFDPWQAEQNRLDRLQRESYLKDQYAIQPGQKAEPPVYGKPRDLLLSVGSNLPEIYLRRLTTTDIAQLEEENRRIRMRNLERQSACSMCNAAFPNYKPEDIAAHYREHADAIAAAGKCPMCATEGWVFMDMDHKKEHIMGHYNEHDSKRIREFFKSLDCPICGEDLQDMDARTVVDHIASHTPEVIRFCDICGLDLDAVNKTELCHHADTCREWDHDLKEDGTTLPHFCGQCGVDRTKPETDCERRAHGKVCRTIKYENCENCGVDLTGFSDEDYATHGRRCKVPRGMRKTWCRKCGRNVHAMDAIAKAYHRNDCLLKPPASVSKDSRINDLQALIAKQRSQESKNNSDKAELTDLGKNYEADLEALQTLQLKITNQQNASDPAQLKAAQKKLHDCEEESKRTLGPCPFGQDCQNPAIEQFSRAQLWDHLKFHADQAGTTPPKATPTGNGSAGFKALMPWFMSESQRISAAADDAKKKMKAASLTVQKISPGGNSNNGGNSGNETAEVTKLNADIARLNAFSDGLLDQIKKLKTDLAQARKKTLTDAECDQKSEQLKTDLTEAQQKLVGLRSELQQTITKVDCEAAKTALNDRIADLEGQLAAANKKAASPGGNNPTPEGQGPPGQDQLPPPPPPGNDDNQNPAPGPQKDNSEGSSNGGGGGGVNDIPTPPQTLPQTQTGFLPSPPGGYRVRGSPKKSTTSPRKRSGAAGSPSKKRKIHAPEEDDSYGPIPLLDVSTPAPVMPRSKRARTDAGSEEDYVIVGESMTSAPPRRSTRAASGTPAPSAGPSLVVKKGRGRPKKDVDDDSPEALDEDDESDGQVITVKSSLRKGSRNSPAKRK
ncbi:hypothetical protein BDZ45DRAFT_806524 [Acephala macrosclerotiorum]|nr:hypothetical protein BDZ45DRAFT_806524 [Acephala macrosclerotiorum]